jgi:hypothetical protein
MSIASALVVAAAFAATAPMSPQGAGPATLTFHSEGQLLAGSVYGLDAIDEQTRFFGQRLSAEVAAGHRTVRYSCPTAPAMDGGSRLTFDFIPGGKYELVCRSGQAAEIRRTDDC